MHVKLQKILLKRGLKNKAMSIWNKLTKLKNQSSINNEIELISSDIMNNNKIIAANVRQNSKLRKENKEREEQLKYLQLKSKLSKNKVIKK